MRISNDIDVVDHISKQDFNEQYLWTQRPLIIKGLIENEPAGNKWSFDYFKNTMGDIPVDVYDNGRNASSSAYTSADMKMRFADFLSEIEQDGKTDLRMFLFNLFKHNPALRKEFPCPKIFKSTLTNYGLTFFGGKGTVVRIHYDIDMSNVLHTQVIGCKRVVLVSPEYNELLYKLPLNTYSLVDIDKPDYDKYPGLRYVKASECYLEPGDSLFMPSGYWHLMRYLTPGMSVAYRKIAQTNRIKLKGLQNMFLNLPVDKCLVALQGKKWQKQKEMIATRRANDLIGNLQGELIR